MLVFQDSAPQMWAMMSERVSACTLQPTQRSWHAKSSIEVTTAPGNAIHLIFTVDCT